ncbi:hypothetical protein Ade02nite_09770 [Paractinoplanes deccanensis]|uniref:Uncharacterized protein n=2 Tax=Paractinoplanes deccanensis TaxID=113561 RepID=A0ABQ3XX87_9ACTN|nr:hypothetical protein Ade02nite_09770 [Actinoplanes deccanensis]
MFRYRAGMHENARRRGPWILISLQAIVVTAYLYGVIAYVTTEATFFPEQSPPAWAFPAVVATAAGFLVAVPCVLLALPRLTRPAYRTATPSWRLLAAATAASVLMLAVMATPPGWEIFDWYVS